MLDELLDDELVELILLNELILLDDSLDDELGLLLAELELLDWLDVELAKLMLLLVDDSLEAELKLLKLRLDSELTDEVELGLDVELVELLLVLEADEVLLVLEADEVLLVLDKELDDELTSSINGRAISGNAISGRDMFGITSHWENHIRSNPPSLPDHHRLHHKPQ